MSKSFGVISRADLVRLQEQKREAETAFIAQQLGLEQDLEVLASPQTHIFPLSESATQDKKLETSSQEVDRSKQLNPWFWYLDKRDWHDEEKLEQPSTASYTAWRNRPLIAEHIPLYSKQAIITHLLPLLRQTERGRKPDLDQVIKTLSRAEPLRALPPEQRQAEHAPLVIVVDRSRHLIPYWQDQVAVIQMLQQLGYQDTQLAVLVEGEAVPRLISEQVTQDWSVPQGAFIVLLSDLGALQQQGRQEQIWLQLGRLLKHQNNTLIALLPCAVQRLSPAVQRLVQGVSVAHASTDFEWEQQQAELLLTALAPCIRIEPSLLRDMRLKMATLGDEWQMGAAVESLVWQHGALAEAHSVAASWNSETRKGYLQRFAALSDVAKTQALATIRAWRGAVSENIWYEELLSLDSDSQQLAVIEEDVQQAVEKLYFIVQQAQTEVISAELAAYYRRFEQRVPEECVTRSAALQQIIGLFGTKQHLIDPQHLPAQGAKRQALLYQRGTQLFLCPFDPFKTSSAGMSPLAIVQLRSDSVQVCDEQGQGLVVLSLADSHGFELGERRALQIRSEVEVLHLATRQAPEGCEMGRDRYGLYVDLAFFGVVQRFRWIPAGRFTMGSPENELEWESWGKETLHEVTLTTGFWLADTACTQALWQAVMGKNPSEFKESEQQPVEQVSWLEVQQFLDRLSQTYSGLVVSLPTEAQWEYACRAGTTTPFSFGEMITTEQVNYDGNYPYAGGEEGEYREKTVVVKSLPANSWGLYEMHGNVWEWCVDEWREDLGSSPVSNPAHVQCLPDFPAASSLKQTGVLLMGSLVNAGDEAVARVLRGGSWDNYGRDCRSAFRRFGTVSERLSPLGFRFVLGHELQHRSSELTKPQSARRGAAQTEARAGSGSLWQRLKKGLGFKGNNET